MEDGIWNSNTRGKEWEPNTGRRSSCQSLYIWTSHWIVFFQKSFRKLSDSSETLSIWFTEKASSERNRESSFHIIVILSVIWVCKCWPQSVRPEVDNYPRQSSQGSYTQMLPEPDSKWMKLSRFLAHIARLEGASCDYQRKSQFSSGLIDKILDCGPSGTNSDFSGKDRTLTLVKSSSFSRLTQIYQTMCSEQNSSLGYLVSNMTSLQLMWLVW